MHGKSDGQDISLVVLIQIFRYWSTLAVLRHVGQIPTANAVCTLAQQSVRPSVAFILKYNPVLWQHPSDDIPSNTCPCFYPVVFGRGVIMRQLEGGHRKKKAPLERGVWGGENPKPVKRCKFGWFGVGPRNKNGASPLRQMTRGEAAVVL